MAKIIPPGLEGNLEHYLSGGDSDAEWMPFDTKRYYTNAFIVEDQKLLLGYKKRGFGKGKYNGFGGKVESGETPIQAASRELEEEAGVKAPLEYAGTLLFYSEGAEWAHHIEFYRASTYIGTITESDEMRPEWFSLSPSEGSSTTDTASEGYPQIPFESMWETDRYWLPLLLSKRIFVGRSDFKNDGDKFTPCKWWFGVTPGSTSEERSE